MVNNEGIRKKMKGEMWGIVCCCSDRQLKQTAKDRPAIPLKNEPK